MVIRAASLSLAALTILTGCLVRTEPDPTLPPIPPGISPWVAVLGRPPTDADCFENAFELVTVPDSATLERHLVTAARRPAWLPSRGFAGTPDQLAVAVAGRLIDADPQTAWVLVQVEGAPRADRYFPLVGRSGERVWYRDATIRACV
jgi:hypothetical protein